MRWRRLTDRDIVSRSRPGPPVIIKKQKAVPDVPDNKTEDKPVALFLWPFGLRYHFWYLALLLAGVLGFANPTVLGVLWGFVVLLFVTWVIPWITYSLCGVPVLDDLWEVWPPFLNVWFQGIPQLGPGSRRNKPWDTLIAYFPPVGKNTNAVEWSLRGSPQTTMLRVAIADLYRRASEDYPSVWLDKAFKRWVFYWYCPVWGSYLALLLILIPAYLWGSDFLPYDKLDLTVAVWLWMLYGMLYALRASSDLMHWGKPSDNDLLFMPPQIRWQLKEISRVAITLRQEQVKAVFALVQLVGTGAYLSIINALYA